MLKQLHISNYALIDTLDINFNDGLTIITGETGAGKSIILGALSLILGERADAKAIRDKARKTIVEGAFDLSGYQLESLFEKHEIDFYEHDCIIRREISASGRSRTFINDTPVTVTLLKEIMTRIVDIHSQHSNMLLSRAAYQLEILDNIAGNQQLLNDYQATYAQYKEAEQNLKQLVDNFNRVKTEEDYINFQLNQFDALRLQPDEDSILEEEMNRLSNLSSSKEVLWRADEMLQSGENAIVGQLAELANLLQTTERNLKDIEGLAERVRVAAIDLKDVAQTVGAIGEDLEANPNRLTEVEQRLGDIYAIERKHNVDSVEQLLEIEQAYRKQIAEIESSDEQINKERERLNKLRDALQIKAEALRNERQKAAKRFEQRLQQQAVDLAMPNLRFDIKFRNTDFTKHGADEVEYLFAFNKNQELMPVKDTASGGEISRLMLCIKAIIAQHMNLPTIIFDEVDTGVSGEVANKVGALMSRIARNIQVITITHLPQVAAHAKQHMQVTKTDDESATSTTMQTLSAEEHVLEMARMLSGEKVNQAAIDNAKALLASALLGKERNLFNP